MDFDNAGIGLQSHLQVAFERAQKVRHARRINLQLVGRDPERIGRGHVAFAAKFHATIQVQLLDHLQGQQIALQDFDFGIQVGRIVVVGGRSRVLEIDEAGIKLVDRDAAGGIVDRCHAQGSDQHQQEDHHHTRKRHKFALDENAQVFAQNRVIGGKWGIDTGAYLLTELHRRNRLQFANRLAVGGDQRSWFHLYSLPSSPAPSTLQAPTRASGRWDQRTKTVPRIHPTTMSG